MPALVRVLALIVCLAALLPASVRAADETPVEKWTLEGFSAPESAHYDAKTGHIYVSNVAGSPAKKDGQGWISKVTADGKVVAAKWAEGFNAPKGIGTHGDTLWVSDIDRLVPVDLATGKPGQEVPVAGAVFLNDVVCGPDGAVYVSDMLTSTIHKYADGKLTRLANGKQLESPNGLALDGNRLIVAAWGHTTDFTTETPGTLYALDLKTLQKTPITEKPLGNLDGLEVLAGGGYLVSDWPAGKVYLVSPKGQARELLSLGMGTADLGYVAEKKLLVLPRMADNKVTAYDLEAVLP